MKSIIVAFLMGLAAPLEGGEQPKETLPDIVYTEDDQSKLIYRENSGKGSQLHSTVCQNFLGYQFFDFKALDLHMRDTEKRLPADVTSEQFGDFQFKLCQKDWNLDDEDNVNYMQPASPQDEFCTKKSQAFYASKHSTRQCTTNFPAPFVKGIHQVEKKDGQETIKDSYAGYQLTWTSTKTCKADKKYKYTLNVLCDQNAAPHKYNDHDQLQIDFDWKKAQISADDDKCEIVANYQGVEGCSRFDLNGLLKPIIALQGVFEIVFGLLLTFAGAWSLKNTVKFLIFICASGSMLLILYNTKLFYVGLNDGQIWILVLLIVSVLAVGLIITLIVGKQIKAHLIQIVGATLAGLITFFALMPVGGIPSYAKYILTVVAAAIGFFTFKILKKPVITFCTSIIGAIMFFHGISQFTKTAAVQNLDIKEGFYKDPLFWVFSVGTLILTAVGTFVQYKYFNMEDYDPNDFTKPSQNSNVIVGEQSLVDVPLIADDEETQRRKREEYQASRKGNSMA